MHPQTFLSTFWRMELRPQVFVAMSFEARYQERFDAVMLPAIESLTAGGVRLKAVRVDVSKSGDSILTDISDGIAHSRLVLADVSSIGRDAVTGVPYRNGNVLYEVGLALACRHASEVLLVRDDHDRFLFDVSTVPHLTVDLTEQASAVATLHRELEARLREQSFHRDARVQKAIASMSAEEVTLLRQSREYTAETVWGREVKNLATWYALATARLLDKGLIRLVGEFPDDEKPKPAFQFTELGIVVRDLVGTGLRQFQTPVKEPTIDAGVLMPNKPLQPASGGE